MRTLIYIALILMPAGLFCQGVQGLTMPSNPYNASLSSTIGDPDAFWPLDGNLDDTYEFRDGTASGTLSYDYSDYVNGTASLIIDASDDAMDIDQTNLGNQWSMGMKGRKYTRTTNDGSQIMAANTTAINAGPGGMQVWEDWWQSETGVLILYTWDGVNQESASSNTGVHTDDDWYSWLITYDYGTVKFYVDGVDVTSDGTVQNDWNKDATITIGNSTNHSYAAEGKIDGPALWLKVLNEDEINDFFNN